MGRGGSCMQHASRIGFSSLQVELRSSCLWKQQEENWHVADVPRLEKTDVTLLKLRKIDLGYLGTRVYFLQYPRRQKWTGNPVTATPSPNWLWSALGCGWELVARWYVCLPGWVHVRSATDYLFLLRHHPHLLSLVYEIKLTLCAVIVTQNHYL